MSAVKFKFTGVAQTMQRLVQCKRRVQTKWLRKAGNEASKVALRMLKSNSPPRNRAWGTGTWRKSLGRKVQPFRRGVGVWYGVGPRSKYVATPARKFKYWRDKLGRVRKMPVEGYTPRYRPALYSHLIEPKHHMIKRSMQQSRGAQQAAITKVLTDAMADV